MTPRVVGVDLSLTSTGLADSAGHVLRVQTKPTKGTDPLLDTLARLLAVRGQVMQWAFAATLVVVEGPSYGQGRQSGDHARAGLWWAVAEGLTYDMPSRLLVVPPATLKTYATGKGNASKDAVLAAAVKRYPAHDVTGNDVADATVLAAIGARILGHPIDDLPKTHLRALTTLDRLGAPK